ncbi:uncharacterized protein LOC134289848 [Aedes albopictus]|uniref:Retrotransposon gag domain-containing protein n=1 Tax=Aedes albopictus TaxID=7160 RepID=A0ABM1YGF2_AEDAL
MNDEHVMIYQSMNVAHLLDDEVEHELVIRREKFSSGDSRDVKRRKLRGVMKLQRDKNDFTICLLKDEQIEAEFQEIDEKLAKIREALENRLVKKVDMPPLKTRLVHLLFRLRRLKEGKKFDTQGLENAAVQMLNNYFSFLSTDPDAVLETQERLRNDLSRLSVQGGKENGEDEETESLSEEDVVVARRKGKKRRPTSTPRKIRRRKMKSPDKMMKMMMSRIDKYLEQKLSSLNLSRGNEMSSSQSRGPGNSVEVVESVSEEEQPQAEGSGAVGRIQVQKNSKPTRKTQVDDRAAKRREETRRAEVCDESSEDDSDGSTSSSDEEESSSSDGARRSKRKGSSRRPRPVADWKLKYDGKDDGKLLNKFIAEVEFMAEAENISKRTLFKEAIHLFAGEVRTWYMDGKRNKDFRNWSELVTELKLEYQSPDLDFHYEQQATQRRQRRSEKFSEYYNAIKEIFGYMSVPPTEDRKFDIVFRNLRSDYKNALVVKNIRTLKALKVWGRKLDSANWYLYRNKDNEAGQKSAQVHEVSRKPFQKPMGTTGKDWKPKSFGNRVPEQKHQDQKFPRRPAENQKPPTPRRDPRREPSPQEGSSAGTLARQAEMYRMPDSEVCFNCRGKNHHYKSCLQKREKFCTKCGLHDFTTENCLFCQKNGRKST